MTLGEADANRISTLKTVIARGSVVIKSDPTRAMTLSGDIDTRDIDNSANNLALTAGSLVLGGNIFFQAKRVDLNNLNGALDVKGFTLDANGALLTYSGDIIKSDVVVGKYAIELGKGSFTRRFFVGNAPVVTIDSVGYRIGNGASQTLSPFLFGLSANGVGGIHGSGTPATEFAVSGKLIVEGNGSGGSSDLIRLTGGSVDLSAGMATTTPLTIVASDPLGSGINLLGAVSAGDFSLYSLAGIAQSSGSLTTTRLNLFAKGAAGLDQSGNSLGTVGTINQPFYLNETLVELRTTDSGLISLTTGGTMRLDGAIQGRVSLTASTAMVTQDIEVNGSDSLLTFNVGDYQNTTANYRITAYNNSLVFNNSSFTLGNDSGGLGSFVVSGGSLTVNYRATGHSRIAIPVGGASPNLLNSNKFLSAARVKLDQYPTSQSHGKRGRFLTTVTVTGGNLVVADSIAVGSLSLTTLTSGSITITAPVYTAGDLTLTAAGDLVESGRGALYQVGLGGQTNLVAGGIMTLGSKNNSFAYLGEVTSGSTTGRLTLVTRNGMAFVGRLSAAGWDFAQQRRGDWLLWCHGHFGPGGRAGDYQPRLGQWRSGFADHRRGRAVARFGERGIFSRRPQSDCDSGDDP